MKVCCWQGIHLIFSMIILSFFSWPMTHHWKNDVLIHIIFQLIINAHTPSLESHSTTTSVCVCVSSCVYTYYWMKRVRVAWDVQTKEGKMCYNERRSNPLHHWVLIIKFFWLEVRIIQWQKINDTAQWCINDQSMKRLYTRSFFQWYDSSSKKWSTWSLKK